MKISVRLVGDGFARADALVADVRRRATEHVQARIEREREARRRDRDARRATKPAAR